MGINYKSLSFKLHPKYVTFTICVIEAYKIQELIVSFDRLFGVKLKTSLTSHGLDALIYRATGFEKEQHLKFFALVYEFVWLRLPADSRLHNPVLDEFYEQKFRPILNELMPEQLI